MRCNLIETSKKKNWIENQMKKSQKTEKNLVFFSFIQTKYSSDEKSLRNKKSPQGSKRNQTLLWSFFFCFSRYEFSETFGRFILIPQEAFIHRPAFVINFLRNKGKNYFRGAKSINNFQHRMIPKKKEKNIKKFNSLGCILKLLDFFAMWRFAIFWYDVKMNATSESS